MYYSHAQQQQQVEAKRNAQAEVLNTAQITLRKTASLIRRRDFQAWLENTDSRFQWAGAELHSKLKANLLYQVYSAVIHTCQRDTPAAEQLDAYADMCEAEAQRIIDTFNIKTTKQAGRWTLPRGSDMAEAVHAMLKEVASIRFTEAFQDVEFYVRNALTAFETYAQARMTLAHSTGHQGFESLLEGLAADQMAKGYPEDLLAHDASDIRNGKQVYAITIRQDYCSTCWHKDQDSLDKQVKRTQNDNTGWTVYRMTNKPQLLKVA